MTDDRRQTTDSRRKTKIEHQILNGEAGILCRITSHEPRIANKAFTLIELVVAVALLAMVLAFASVIFKVGIESYRTSSANAEIMQKLRAITDQLNRDFMGIRTDAPLLIWFFQDASDPNQRYDQIMFFADGDFQSTQLYDGTPLIPAPTGSPVIGNVARIYYGQAMVNLLNPWQQVGDNERERTLARRRHILTADPYLYSWFTPVDFTRFGALDTFGYGYINNEFYEHDSLSLSQWKTIDQAVYNDPITPTCFVIRPQIDWDNSDTFHKLMCEGVGSLSIKWAYWDPLDPMIPDDDKLLWFPSDDPDGMGSYISNFVSMDNKNAFGVFFNIPNGSQFGDWYTIADASNRCSQNFLPFPKALKFTFTLYDSKGILEEGRKFTHIVYVGD